MWPAHPSVVRTIPGTLQSWANHGHLLPYLPFLFQAQSPPEA